MFMWSIELCVPVENVFIDLLGSSNKIFKICVYYALGGFFIYLGLSLLETTL